MNTAVSERSRKSRASKKKPSIRSEAEVPTYCCGTKLSTVFKNRKLIDNTPTTMTKIMKSKLERCKTDVITLKAVHS